MGLVYHLLPRLGYGMPARRMATFSSYCYALGQAMHIGGLMWSGGYGVQRKVAGTEQVLRSTQEVVAMGVMGLGGLVAIIGGPVFVVVGVGSIEIGAASATAVPSASAIANVRIFIRSFLHLVLRSGAL